MSHRTTLILDEASRAAASELAHRYGCTTSEAIRRAIVEQRNAEIAIPRARREERVRTLSDLFELFEGNDPETEVARLKLDDEET